MSCYHPIEVRNKRTGEVRLVPCGKCLGCKQDYQNSWKIRLNETLKAFDYTGVFFTLTYAPDSAPCVTDAVDHDTGEWFGDFDDLCKDTPFDRLHDRHRILQVCVEDVQSWLKRSRRRMQRFYGKSIKFKYFITSEYGPNTLRPHYHGIITIKKSDFEKFFLSDWTSAYVRKYYKDKTSKLVKNKFYKGNVDYEEVVFDGGKSPLACCDYISKYCSKGCFENPRVSRGYVAKLFICVLKDLVLNIWSDCVKIC